MDEEDFSEGGDQPPKMAQVKCNYCGKIVELRNTVRLNPETEEYEYACESCAKRLELNVDTSEPTYIG